MRIWTRKSASIQPRTSLGKSDTSHLMEPRFVVLATPRLAPGAPGPRGRRGRAARLDLAAKPTSCTDTALFRRVVLGWIEADFRVQIRIFQHFSKSTRKSPSREQILEISAQKLEKIAKILTFFVKLACPELTLMNELGFWLIQKCIFVT